MNVRLRPRSVLFPLACLALACSPLLFAWLRPAARAAAGGQPLNKAVALKGLDPVLLTEGKEVKGKPDLSVTREGFRYLFADAANRAKFEKDPERYEIQFHGQCAVMPGARSDPSLFVVYKGYIYAFGGEQCMDSFQDRPGEFVRPRKNVALFVFDGMEILDFAGPAEVFSSAGKGRAFHVYTVGVTKDPITSQGLITTAPRFTIADCPKPDLIVVPGGNTRAVAKDPRVLDWLRQRAPETEVTLSVCTGAFVLANAGLLNGKAATTHWGSVERLREQFPKVAVQDDRRFVDNGKVVTAAGVSAGIDAALHVVDRLLGRLTARETARYMEYDWRPEPAKKK
jgi:putative intracellular protease/amidase/YHS domain-containing protein